MKAKSHSSSTANRTQLGYEDQSYQVVGAGRDAQVVRTIAQAGRDLTQQVTVRDTSLGVPAPVVQRMLDRILAGGQQALTQIERQNQISLAALAASQSAPGSTLGSPAKVAGGGTTAQLARDARVAIPWLAGGAILVTTIALTRSLK